MQTLLRTRETFQVEVPLRAFFAAPTVADLAVAVLGGLGAQAETDGLVDRLLAEVEALPDTEVRQLLADQGETTSPRRHSHNDGH